MHGRVRACLRSTAQQMATTAVGLELASHDGLDGTIGLDGKQSRAVDDRDDRFASAAGERRAIAMATFQASAQLSSGLCFATEASVSADRC